MLKKITSNVNGWIIATVLLLLVGVFCYVDHSNFEGSDSKAEELISSVDPNYQIWFSNIWEPPGAEMESLLFAFQAALGSGVLFYIIGYYKGKNSKTYSSNS